jgi:hypothetical protein
MLGPIGLLPALAPQGGTALWACVGLLIALCLTLVIVSIIFGGNRGRVSAGKERKAGGGRPGPVRPEPD